MTKIIWDKNAITFLRKLEKLDKKRILKKINIIKQNPLHYLKSLVNIDAYKLRFGDYRIFADYSKKEDELIIRSIKHRKNAYKNIK